MITNNHYDLLFVGFSKNNWLHELTDINSNVYALIKEEVEELFFKTGGYLISIDFDSCYKLAVEVTIHQVQKSIKKNEKCFFETENNNSLIYKKVKERLVNNIKNLFDPKRKTNILNFEILLIDEIYENYEVDFIIRDLQKLVILEPELIIKQLKKLVNNFELTSIEIEELGQKLNMDFSTIPELNLSLQFKNLRKDANNQVFFVFEIEKVA